MTYSKTKTTCQEWLDLLAYSKSNNYESSSHRASQNQRAKAKLLSHISKSYASIASLPTTIWTICVSDDYELRFSYKLMMNPYPLYNASTPSCLTKVTKPLTIPWYVFFLAVWCVSSLSSCNRIFITSSGCVAEND